MEKCKTCIHYKNFLFTRPICNRISNIEVKTQKNIPFKVYEAYKICKGYFYVAHSKKECSLEEQLPEKQENMFPHLEDDRAGAEVPVQTQALVTCSRENSELLAPE